MIVPQVAADTFSVREVDALIARLLHWSLFGKVALVNCQSWSVDELENISQFVGGRVELLIEFQADDPSDYLKLLNAGATGILNNAAIPSNLPGRCWVNWNEQDEAEPRTATMVRVHQPSAEQMASLTIKGLSSLVDSSWLDQDPGMIADFFQSVMVTDRPDGLWPTVVVDSLGMALGLAYSNSASLRDAIEHRRGSYWSRSRGGLWIKGSSSGAIQKLIGIRWDCDRDCLRFQVDQQPPGFCHRETYTCFGEERSITTVVRRLQQRIGGADPQSFTQKLANDAKMLEKKLLEEAAELAAANSDSEVAFETADVFYFSLVKMLSAGVKLEDVYQELFRRMNRVERRPNKLEN